MIRFCRKSSLIFFCWVLIDVSEIFCFINNRNLNNYKINRIEIIGNKIFSEHSIKKVMLTRGKGFFSNPTFHRDLYKDDLNTIKQLYYNKGYLDIQLTSEITAIDSLKKSIVIKIYIAEGQPTYIDSISFIGNNVFGAEKLSRLISLKKKRPFNQGFLEKDNYNLLAYYAQNGYIDTIIKPELIYQSEEHLLSIRFKIEEGIQVVVNDFEITGLEKTKPVVVEREIMLKPGQVFDYQKMLKSRRRLIQTGLFENIMINPVLVDSARPDLRNVRISLDEKKGGELNFGIGFGSYEKARGSTEFIQNNLRGRAYQIGTRLRVSYRLQRFEMVFTNPWLCGKAIKYDFNAFGEHKIEPNYELQEWGTLSTVGMDVSERAKIDLTFKYENADYSHIKDVAEINRKNRGNIRSIRLTSIRDTRDSQLNSTSGTYLDVKVESAGWFLRGKHTFLKIANDFRYFRQVHKNPKITIGMRFFIGWMKNYGGSDIIPLNERFYAGGDGSIRGYARRSVGPKTVTDYPMGGKSTFISNWELRFPIYKRLGGTFFWDAGDVWHSLNEIDLIKARHGLGCGVRFNSELGIIRIDAGMKVDRRSNESFGEIYFTLGHIF